MLIVAIVSCLIVGSYAQSDSRGSCLNFIAVDFDPYQGGGAWWEYAATYDPYYGELRCIIENWGIPDGNRTSLVTTAIDVNTGNQVVTESRYTKDRYNNKLHVVSPLPLFGRQTIDFFDMEDVYNDYIITSYCMIQGSRSVPVVLILTRSPNPRTNVIARAQQVARRRGVPVGKFIRFDTNCN
ncbi:Protein of unknown function [Cotesia congregata]|uniref:Lipocalin/cytosolic fatty-acid binding domain-containing protein n=1 Tax=Cotesia congregata TaxID=51543 RepID=A0A8J2H5H5_COTCN|nr:Protein of unknown function [Cotesia congregata]